VLPDRAGAHDMFDLFSWSHIVILLVVALVVVGPKDLPRLMNMMGRWAGKARAMANEFRKSFDEMARQAELDELRKEIDELKKNNPVSGITDAMNEMQSQIESPAVVPDAAAEPVAPTEAPSEAPVEGASEPRAGEFEVTGTPSGEATHTASAP
jgi:sec-independent protein translocase protein TatB